MKRTLPIYLFALTLASCALLSSCAKNPADDVAAAEVTEPAAGETAATQAPSPVEGKKYRFTEDSTVGFVGSKVTGSHEGGFRKFDGYFTVAGDRLVGNDHKVVIDMGSTWADHPKLEGHLKAPDFFDVEKFPESAFDLNSIKKGEGDNYTLSGDLTLHGVTKSISFPATISGDANQFHLAAEFAINRFDFEIVYPGKTDDLIRKEVVIKLDLKAVPD